MLTPVSASISTPVLPMDVNCNCSSHPLLLQIEEYIEPGDGDRMAERNQTGVSLTARMAASLAVVRTSPFFTFPAIMALIVRTL